MSKFIVVLDCDDGITSGILHECLCRMFHEGYAIHDLSEDPTSGESLIPEGTPVDFVNDVMDVVQVNIEPRG